MATIQPDDLRGTTPYAVIGALAGALRTWDSRETWYHQALFRFTDLGSSQPFYACMRVLEAVLAEAETGYDRLTAFERGERGADHMIRYLVLEAIELVCRYAAAPAR